MMRNSTIFSILFCSLAGVNVAILDLDGMDISAIFENGQVNRTKSLVKGATLEDHLLYKLSEALSEEKEVSGIYLEVFLSMKETLENQYADLLNDSPEWSREAAYQK